MQKLPLEVITHIANFLDAKDRHNFGHTNKFINIFWYKHDICNKLPKNIYFQDGFFRNPMIFGTMKDINEVIFMIAQYIRNLYDKNEKLANLWFRYFIIIASREMHMTDVRHVSYPITYYPKLKLRI